MGCLVWLLRVLVPAYAMLSGLIYGTIDPDYFWHGLFASLALLLIGFWRHGWLLIAVTLAATFLPST